MRLLLPHMHLRAEEWTNNASSGSPRRGPPIEARRVEARRVETRLVEVRRVALRRVEVRRVETLANITKDWTKDLS